MKIDELQFSCSILSDTIYAGKLNKKRNGIFRKKRCNSTSFRLDYTIYRRK